MSHYQTGHRGGQQRSKERGASAVEAAIVTPLVMTLVFGIVELGFLFKDYMAVAGAVRAGVRIASANPRNTDFAQAAADNVAQTGGAMNFNDVQQLWVYKVEAQTPNLLHPADPVMNKPIGVGDFSRCDICARFIWQGGKFVRTGTEDWLASSQNACPASRGGPPERIGVYIQLKHDPFTGFFKTVTISEASIMTLEPLSSLTACKPTP